MLRRYLGPFHCAFSEKSASRGEGRSGLFGGLGTEELLHGEDSTEHADQAKGDDEGEDRRQDERVCAVDEGECERDGLLEKCHVSVVQYPATEDYGPGGAA